MGTGKTTVGKMLAGELNRCFREMDEEIEKLEKRTINDIFAQEGESYFRRKETEVLERLAGQDHLVVSCGGGVIIAEKNRELLKQSGIMICLTAEADIIYQRTKSCKNRPLLNVPDPQRKISELMRARAHLYAQAHYSIDTSKLSIREVVAKIREIIPA